MLLAGGTPTVTSSDVENLVWLKLNAASRPVVSEHQSNLLLGMIFGRFFFFSTAPPFFKLKSDYF